MNQSISTSDNLQTKHNTNNIEVVGQML